MRVVVTCKIDNCSSAHLFSHIYCIEINMKIKIEPEPIDRNPKILSGTPVFSGTRVPVRILLEHLEVGDRIDEFLNDFPTVSRDQAVAVLEYAKVKLVGDTRESAA